MSQRTAWAVEAAEHLAAALRVIPDGSSIEANQAMQETSQAYQWVLYSIGTIPGSRTDEVYDATVRGGATVTQALDAIGA